LIAEYSVVKSKKRNINSGGTRKKESIMSHIARRIVNISVAFALAVTSVSVSGFNASSASAKNGNNGTLKVHEIGTPSGTESNDPKVCAFNFEGFGFDAGQDGYIVVETQPGNVSSLVPSPMPFGPTDGTGFAVSSDVNNSGTYELADGHYKATLYGKDTGNPANPDLNDDKAKSKVFKVECEEEDGEVLGSAVTADPTSTDLCGTENDGYTVVPADHVSYLVNGQVVSGGFHNATDSVTIDAIADSGYTLEGDTQWTFDFTNEACEVPCDQEETPVILRLEVALDQVQDQTNTCDEPEDTGEVLGDSTTLTLPKTASEKNDSVIQLLAGMIGGASIYGLVYYLIDRRNVYNK
jgi:hypothetical protein